MKTQGSFLLGGIFLIFNGAVGRAIPDFYTDEDLNAWHKFGLRSFYGPWSVIARKPNGDFVSYADYGSRVPSDFRPISSSPIDDEFSPVISQQQLPSNDASGISDFAASYGSMPYGVAIFSKGVQSPNSETDLPQNLSDFIPNGLLDEKNFETSTNLQESTAKDTEKKRDTLELIGIVGVISDDDSTDNDRITFPSIDANTEDDDYGSTTTDQTINVSSL